MRQRIVKAQKVLKFTTQATLKDLDKYTGTKPCEIFQEAIRLGYQCTEPQIWQYYGMDDKPDTEFSLDIMLPIQGKGNGLSPKDFEIVDIPEFKCVSKIHEGEWKEMGRTYNELLQYCINNNLKYNYQSREVYVRCDFEEHENCITEVQLGIL